MSKKKNRIGEEKLNNFGSKMKIIEYRNANDIDIYFEEYNWIFKNASYINYQRGNISCPYEKRTFGIGYLGEGEYNPSKNKNIFKRWQNMLGRCYSKASVKYNPTYDCAEVSDEWLCFQNFAKWYNENYYEIKNNKMCLDKDILKKGNKIYSANTCIFVPEIINNLFVKSDKTRGEYPIGVTYNKEINKFESKYTNKNKTIKLGYYNTPKEAFDEYKKYKEKHIKEVAEEYKNKIPNKLYKAMINYKVEITD